MRRIAYVLAGVAALVALFVVLRPDDGDEPATTGAATTTRRATTTAATTAQVAPPPPAQLTVRIDYRQGKAPRILKVKEGRRLVLVVSADVADEVHLHGYDLSARVRPGAPARIAFRATLPGRFELELEERGVLIGELEVRP